ncbi:MAG TPA: metal ABC transporter substrate-binding protein [Dissulfurispiraceae bacterium]|nr:metal ABC transporter substrate-binding protein [Dissulfurispiraceae bacterium]
MIRFVIFALTVFLSVTCVSCQKTDITHGQDEKRKIRVVTSLFPLYDFVRAIGKERVDVSLMLPPGVEPHSFEPRPADILGLNNTDIFVYTNQFMEPWVSGIIKGIDNKHILVIDSSKGIRFIEENDEEHKDGHHLDDHGHVGMDPHVWLDLRNSMVMVDNICNGLIVKDPANEIYYRKNAEQYKAVLRGLDDKFRQGLGNCDKKTFINGGHFAFGYLAARYNLQYLSAYGFSPDAEPAPGQLIMISKIMKRKGLHYIFYEELLAPNVAEAISRETGAKLLFLHGAHNVSSEEFKHGISFVAIMEKNLENLETGLQCRNK